MFLCCLESRRNPNFVYISMLCVRVHVPILSIEDSCQSIHVYFYTYGSFYVLRCLESFIFASISSIFVYWYPNYIKWERLPHVYIHVTWCLPLYRNPNSFVKQRSRSIHAHGICGGFIDGMCPSLQVTEAWRVNFSRSRKWTLLFRHHRMAIGLLLQIKACLKQ